MAYAVKNQELFYSRTGMLRRGPFTRKALRRLLVAGLLDAHSLVSVDGSKVMLPLGASKAACEITWVARQWYWQYNIALYWIWLIVVPLFSAGLASLSMTNGGFVLVPAAIITGNLGMAFWLYQKWRILLADDRLMPLKSALYAFPMAIPGVNCVWIWIGYMQLPKYWRKFKRYHQIPDNTPYQMYYLVMIIFYAMIIGEILFFYVDGFNNLLMIRLIGMISWIWYGLTLMSLFLTDHITLLLIKSKLSNLAFGALSCCADINYDILHQAVLTLAKRARPVIFMIGGLLLFASWLSGGWLWMYAWECWFMQRGTLESPWLLFNPFDF